MFKYILQCYTNFILKKAEPFQKTVGLCNVPILFYYFSSWGTHQVVLKKLRHASDRTGVPTAKHTPQTFGVSPQHTKNILSIKCWNFSEMYGL